MSRLWHQAPVRLALCALLVIAVGLVLAYSWVHRPFAQDPAELVQVPLSAQDPALDQVGELRYLGGLDIPRMGQNIGGLSGLRWDTQTGRLLAITDDARWVWITPEERGGRLVDLVKVTSGPLLGRDGEPLTGKQQGDSEALSVGGSQGWSVAFERDHRILTYDKIDGPPRHLAENPYDPEEDFGQLDENNGIEAMASDGGGTILTCVERVASAQQSNCRLTYFAEGKRDFPVHPPGPVAERGGVPTDADKTTDGTVFVLFRSYSPAQGNAAAIVAYDTFAGDTATRREIATFLPPLTLDNFEGLAVREEGERLFLYIVSDDNFSSSQRTLLMKFELVDKTLLDPTSGQTGR